MTPNYSPESSMVPPIRLKIRGVDVHLGLYPAFPIPTNNPLIRAITFKDGVYDSIWISSTLTYERLDTEEERDVFFEKFMLARLNAALKDVFPDGQSGTQEPEPPVVDDVIDTLNEAVIDLFNKIQDRYTIKDNQVVKK